MVVVDSFSPWHQSRAMNRPALVLSLSAALVLGCAKRETPAEPPAPPSAPAAQTARPAAASGKLAWTDPPAWKRRPGSNAMRVAEYGVPHASGETDDGECVVTTFGAGQGGAVEANIERWVRQFEPDSAGGLQRAERVVSGMKITTVELAGTYRNTAMPGAPPTTGPKAHYRMVAAIVDAPEGAHFFKLVGPDRTVSESRPAFEALLDSIRR